MGEIADDYRDGTCCCLCGCYFKGGEGRKVHTHGYAVVCWDCWEDLTPDERKEYQRALAPTI